jgi:transmembrane sensor
MDNLMMQELLDRYLSGACSAEEQLIVEKWLERQEGGDNRWSEMDAPAKAAWMALLYQDIQHTIKNNAIAGNPAVAGGNTASGKNAAPVMPIYRRPFSRMAVAAAIIVIIGTGTLWLIRGASHDVVKTSDTERHQNDVSPGGSRAVLTLANGSVIILDSAANGELAKQGNATILKTANGQLAYNLLNEKPTEAFYNTLATPRGGQYQLVLPDGSKVWLNAASSIRFPVAFTGGTRNVEITGEAYFEVAKDKAKPFHVKARGMEVEVLGTHFNINAYPDEPGIRTTLLEGSVKIVVDRQTQRRQQDMILLPGQQARVEGGINLVKKADIDQVMAWKNGLFNFNDADLQTVLRQLARWYDIDIKFEGNGPVRSFHGKITRDLNLSQVINLLQEVEVKFRIEGKTLIVTQ